MKIVIQDLRRESDYLGVLGEMYRQGGNVEAQAAAREAQAALERLIRILEASTNETCPKFPAAA